MADGGAIAPHLGFRELWDDQLRQRAQQTGGKEQHRQHHALQHAVAGERPVGGKAGGTQAPRYQQMLQSA